MKVYDYGEWQRDSVSSDDEMEWQPIETAPKDELILVWAPSCEGLPSMFSLCRYHEDAGFCIDELREPTHWMPLPPPPRSV